MASNVPDLVLASGSTARRQMLEAAGIRFRIAPADIDEEAHRRALEATGEAEDPRRVAASLAEAKAVAVSRRFPDALVIGSDQVLALGTEIFSKPVDLAAARDALLRLAGHTHELHSAVALAGSGASVWSHLDTARLSMRRLAPAEIDAYLAAAGERICASVGAYELEGLGINLFERVDGDYFTILGMPLLPLLDRLRQSAVLAF